MAYAWAIHCSWVLPHARRGLLYTPVLLRRRYIVEEQLRRDRPRCHRVDRDVPAAEFVGQNADETLDASLGGDVRAVRREGPGDDAGREGDDPAARVNAPGRLAQDEERAA